MLDAKSALSRSGDRANPRKAAGRIWRSQALLRRSSFDCCEFLRASCACPGLLASTQNDRLSITAYSMEASAALVRPTVKRRYSSVLLANHCDALLSLHLPAKALHQHSFLFPQCRSMSPLLSLCTFAEIRRRPEQYW